MNCAKIQAFLVNFSFGQPAFYEGRSKRKI